MMPETALIVGEMYRRGGEWKFRVVGQAVGGLGRWPSNTASMWADDPDVWRRAIPSIAAARRPASAILGRHRPPKTDPAGKDHPGKR